MASRNVELKLEEYLSIAEASRRGELLRTAFQNSPRERREFLASLVPREKDPALLEELFNLMEELERSPARELTEFVSEFLQPEEAVGQESSALVRPRETKVVCKRCGEWFFSREGLESHQQKCVPAASPDPARTIRPRAEPAKARHREEAALTCPRCKSDYDSLAEGCLKCRLKEMPALAWISSWALILLGATLVIPTILNGTVELDVPEPLGAGEGQLFLGMGLTWLGWGIRSSRNWAYMSYLSGLLMLGIGALALSAISYLSSDMLDQFLSSEDALSLLVAGLGTLTLALLMTRRSLWNHFKSNWSWDALLSVGAVLILIVASLYTL